MSYCFEQLAKDLTVEPSISHQRLRIFPVSMKRSVPVEYLLLPEAQEQNAVQVEEVSIEGNVPTLNLINHGDKPVFVPDGMLLVGGKQNRTVNVSLIVGAQSKTPIPVSCVEQGRWGYAGRHFRTGDMSSSMLRKMMCLDSSASLACDMKLSVDQRKVWSHVNEALNLSRVASPTASYTALYEDLHKSVPEFEKQLRLPPHACGVAALVDGQLLSVDVYDKAHTLQQLWPQLLRGFLLESLRSKQVQRKLSDVKSFLACALSQEGVSYQSVGIGTTVRLKADNSDGAALTCNNQLVHLSLFAANSNP